MIAFCCLPFNAFNSIMQTDIRHQILGMFSACELLNTIQQELRGSDLQLSDSPLENNVVTFPGPSAGRVTYHTCIKDDIMVEGRIDL